MPEESTRVVFDGVDESRTAGGCRQRGRQSLGIAESDPIVLSVGALDDSKGHRDLVAAMPRVIARFPCVQAVIAGQGELENDLRQQITQLHLEQHVKLLGQRTDVPDLMRAADLFVMPSRVEGLGSAVIEAMFAGCPIIGSAAGGIPELLEPKPPGASPGGWCVPPGDRRRLADAILAALADEDTRRRRAETARRRAERDFTVETMVESTLRVYEEFSPHPETTDRHASEPRRWVA
jgi:glycosyltransferase involved in cell wall biosynthesis